MDPDTQTPNNSPTPPVAQNNTPPPVEPTPPTPLQSTPPPVVPPTPVSGPSQSTPIESELESSSPLPPQPPTPPTKNKTLLIIIAIVVALVLLGVGAFLTMKLFTSASPTTSPSSSTSNQTSGATDITALTSAVLSTPDSATAGLTKSPAGKNPNAVGFTTADQSCLVAYGTATPDLVADTTVNDFVNTYLKSVTQGSTDTTVTGPAVATSRLLTDATDSKKTYSVPTLRFELAENAKHGAGLYSMALLKNNSRLIVETLCINEQGSVTQAQMDSMEAVVKQITVKAN